MKLKQKLEHAVTASARPENVRKLDKRKKVYCARCGEASGGRGTSFWTHVHKYGPTTHRFKPTNTPKA